MGQVVAQDPVERVHLCHCAGPKRETHRACDHDMGHTLTIAVGPGRRGHALGVLLRTSPCHLARCVVEGSHVQGFLGNPPELHRILPVFFFYTRRTPKCTVVICYSFCLCSLSCFWSFLAPCVSCLASRLPYCCISFRCLCCFLFVLLVFVFCFLLLFE